LKILDELCDEGIIDGADVVAQIGSTTYSPRNYKSFDLIARDDYQRYVDAADIIITHAGTGSVVPPLRQGKKIIIFPRLVKYREHLDNHQLELAETFTQQGYALCAQNIGELRKCLGNVEDFIPNQFVSNNTRLNELVIDYIRQW
jgi:UDP-N-acetylglucosamine transferase subunit ALG13